MTIEERKDIVRSNIKWETARSKAPVGGQSCGVFSTAVTLISEELCCKIEIGHTRSQLLNKEYALMLFELILDDQMK